MKGPSLLEVGFVAGFSALGFLLFLALLELVEACR